MSCVQGIWVVCTRFSAFWLRSKRSALGQISVSESVVTRVHDERTPPTLEEVVTVWKDERTKLPRLPLAPLWVIRVGQRAFYKGDEYGPSPSLT